MAHSSVITELLHKLSKNEFLAQDGGNRRYYNKANGYRNQLNQLYGGGLDEDRMTQEIINDIDTLIPISVLEEFVKRAEQQMNQLIEEKTRLETELSAARAASAAGDTEKNNQIAQLNTRLAEVQAEITTLNARLADTERELAEKNTEIDKLKKNIQEIRRKVDVVKGRTVDSDPVKALLARLNASASASAAGPASAGPAP